MRLICVSNTIRRRTIRQMRRKVLRLYDCARTLFFINHQLVFMISFYRFIIGLLFFTGLSADLYAQMTITGRVVDQTNSQPIVGATLQVMGTTRGATADDKGQFQLNVSEGEQVQVSAVVYQTQTVGISAATRTLTVELESSNTDLNEVIVSGYSAPQTIQRIPGAVGLVTSRDIQRTNGIHLQNFVNLIPGVKVEMRTVARRKPDCDSGLREPDQLQRRRLQSVPERHSPDRRRRHDVSGRY